MDPNLTLAHIRHLCEEVAKLSEEFKTNDPEAAANMFGLATELSQSVVDLDTWLSSKGFKPHQWR